MTNTSLANVILNRDEQQFDKLYRQYREEFVSWSLKNFNCDPDEAVEIYQQSMIVLYENVVNNKLKDLTKSKTYLFGIAKNKFHDMWRKESKMEPLGDIDFSVSPDPMMEEYNHENDKINLVKSSLNQLGEPCKSILEQYYYHKKNMKEIAEVLQYKNTDTAKNQKYKCLQRLKRIFQEQYKAM